MLIHEKHWRRELRTFLAGLLLRLVSVRRLHLCDGWEVCWSHKMR